MLGVLASFWTVATVAMQDRGIPYSDLIDKGYTAASANRYGDAVAAFKQALAINPDDGNVWAAMGQNASRAGMLDDVIEAGNAVLKYGAFGAKVRAQAYFEVACAYCAKGEADQGWKALNSAMDAGFRSLDTVRTDKRLDLIRSHKGYVELAALKDTKKMSRDEGWKYDLWLLDRELRRIHKSPYLMLSRQERDKWVGQLKGKISKLSDDQVKVEFYRYVASFGDGHTNIRVPNIRRPKIQVFWFSDGIRVVSAAPEFKDLLGAKIVSIEDVPVDKLIAEVEPLISHENPQLIKSNTPFFITNNTIVSGLGHKVKADSLTLSVRQSDASERSVTLPLVSDFTPKPEWVTMGGKNPPLTLQNRATQFWFKHLPELNSVYVAYNAVQNMRDKTIAAAAAEMYKLVDDTKAKNLIIDVRWNGGGNTFLSQPIIQGLAQRPSISQSGSNLFVITGRNTYSAAQNFTTDIGRLCRPIYVGEPTGSSPNFIGESIPYTLPYSGMSGTISDLYWQRSWPMDDRIWIAPDVPTPPDYQMFAQGLDPSFEAIKKLITKGLN